MPWAMGKLPQAAEGVPGLSWVLIWDPSGGWRRAAAGEEGRRVQPGVGKTSAVPIPNRPPLPLGMVENIWGIWDKAAPIKSIVLSFLC